MQKLHSPRTKRLWCLRIASFRKLSNPVVLCGEVITKQRAAKMCKHCESNGKGLIALSNVKKGSDIDWGAVREQTYCISRYPLHITYESTIDSKKKKERKKVRGEIENTSPLPFGVAWNVKTCFSSFGESDHNPQFQEWHCLASSCTVLVLAIFVLWKTLKRTCYVKGSEKKGMNETRKPLSWDWGKNIKKNKL